MRKFLLGLAASAVLLATVPSAFAQTPVHHHPVHHHRHHHHHHHHVAPVRPH